MGETCNSYDGAGEPPSAHSALRGLCEALLDLRRKLADEAFLRHYWYTEDQSRFVGSTYSYGIRLRLIVEPVTSVQHLWVNLPSNAAGMLRTLIEKQIVPKLPPEYVSLVNAPTNTPPDVSGTVCRRLAEDAIRDRLPGFLPYGRFYGEINRLIGLHQCSVETLPTEQEFFALFSHLNRNMMRKARGRHPEVWDEKQGHFVLDSRGPVFARSFANELLHAGWLEPKQRFLDLGSGIGTMLAAVNRYTQAHATGVEIHAGIARLSQAFIRQLARGRFLTQPRIETRVGDALDPTTIDLSDYDVIYVYSPIGKWQIPIGLVVDRMKKNGILITNGLPDECLCRVEQLKFIDQLSVYRKLS